MLMSPELVPVSDRRQLVISALAAWALLSAPQPADAAGVPTRGGIKQFDWRGLNADDFARLDLPTQMRVERLLRPRDLRKFLQDLDAQNKKLQADLDAAILADTEQAAKLKGLGGEIDVAQRDIATAKKQIEFVEELLGSSLAPTDVLESLEELKTKEIEFKAQLEVATQPDFKETEKLETLADGLEQAQQEVTETKTKLAARDAEIVSQSGPSKLNLIQQRKALINKLDTASQNRERYEEELKIQIEVSKKMKELAEGRQEIVDNLERNKRAQARVQARIDARVARFAALNAQPDWFIYVSAFAANCLATVIMFPVDTIKTRAQVGLEVEESEDTPALESFLALYKGLSGAVIKEGPPSAVYLGVYEAVKNALLASPTFAPYPILVYILGGAIGSSVASVLKAPAEVVKARTQTGMDSSIEESIQNALLDERGRENTVNAWIASMWREVPSGAISLAIFEGLKDYITNAPQPILDFNVDSLAAEVVLGTIGGALGALLTTPADVVTTKIITQSCENPLNFQNMTKKTVEEGGFKALCVGWKERTALIGPTLGIFLSCYCYVRQLGVEQHLFPPP
jgi:hypothetical protein